MHLIIKQQFKFMYAVAIWTDFCEPDWLFRILSVLHASGAQSGLTHGLCMSVQQTAEIWDTLETVQF